MQKRFAIAPLILVAACVAPQRPPAPAPVARPAPPPPPPAPIVTDWRDFPLTPGSWAYRPDAGGSSAMFGRPGAEADLILRCEFASRTITLSWPATRMAGSSGATITTSAGAATFAKWASIAPNRIGLSFAAADPFLDKIAFSRGRFVVTSVGSQGPARTERLVVPAWPEAARAIEDCRK